ncbi:DDE domain-containing protein (plasmid) [Bacillus mycoides]|nr:DDE domain-containing protein [Bacillus mycoides]QWH09922.1 DDE domain-containing protein [Bacillus mycoides]
MSLYRGFDLKGNTIDFFLSKTRNQKAAKRFSRKLCGLFMFQNFLL